ncbi:MAG: acyl-ACP--UDP-N-acetylglucosamine O-acyltransferase [Candidatus Delongbacteria bacterium]|nr:acyl-ACP--UDP-N-acetylglucosamine O-acyltransferase [Candidatus Delongbacteria bacterium]MBN2834675.1 acyl-ACP--UDP-N-acetylglucosamine O-acyltransferase [Candidatus Delongbacteria bacterium]
MIHETAIIDSTSIISNDVTIGANVKIGPYNVIEGDVVISDNCDIGSFNVIAEGTRLSKNVRIFHHNSIGTIPQDLKFHGEKTTFEVGENTIIREFCQLNRGTEYHNTTRIGKNCLIMGYVHLAHDCLVGNNVILVNSAQIAGHCEIEDHVIISGMTAAHQFCRVGKHSMVQGGSKILKDVPPFISAQGTPLRFAGLNKIGLKRRGFTDETIQIISDAYRIVFREKLERSAAIDKLEREFKGVIEVNDIIEFLKKSDTRGYIGLG